MECAFSVAMLPWRQLSQMSQPTLAFPVDPGTHHPHSLCKCVFYGLFRIIALLFCRILKHTDGSSHAIYKDYRDCTSFIQPNDTLIKSRSDFKSGFWGDITTETSHAEARLRLWHTLRFLFSLNVSSM